MKTMKVHTSTLFTYPRMLVGLSSIGLIASFWQAAERVHMLKFPAQPLSCNISPVVDCSGVLNQRVSAIFGPPNAFIGMVAFTLLLAFGMQRATGGEWTRPVRFVVVALSKIMLLFSLWFFTVSVFSIGKICIFCIAIWFVSVPLAIFGMKDFFEHQKFRSSLYNRVGAILTRYPLTIAIYIYLAMIATFFVHFSDYYFG